MTADVLIFVWIAETVLSLPPPGLAYPHASYVMIGDLEYAENAQQSRSMWPCFNVWPHAMFGMCVAC